MKTQTKLWAISCAVVIPISLISYILSLEKLLTTNQYAIISMGCLTAISVFSFMMNLKENTVLKKHSILITLFMLLVIGIVSTVFIAVEFDLTFEFVIFLGIILGSLLFIPLVDWNGKRKKQNAMTEHPKYTSK